MALHRRRFLQTSAASFAMGIALPTAAEAGDEKKDKKPLFEISLAEWSLHQHAAGQEARPSRLRPDRQAKFGIDAVEYVNQFFKDKAKDRQVPGRAEEAGRRRTA